MTKTIATLCSGFDGVSVGAKAAGLELAWGVEIDARIAEVGNANLGGHIKVANILDCDPTDFDSTDGMHASPPCPSFSQAKEGGVETALDIAIARKIAQFASVLKPRIFTLENVMFYRFSKSWRIIEQTLFDAGYWLHAEIIDAADYGVPQNRKRFIVRAVRGGFVPCFCRKEARLGWYSAIADLKSGFKEQPFTEHEKGRFMHLLRDTDCALVDVQNSGRQNQTVRLAGEPAFTMTAACATRHPLKALIDGRIVALSTRAAARLQTFPDWYELPEIKILASKGIGNAVPPILYQRIIEGLVNA